MDDVALLAVQSVMAGYADNVVLRDASLRLQHGSICGLIGPNGAGKTTLLRAIYGLLRPAAGIVALDGRALDGLPPLERRSLGLGYVPQERNVFPNLTVHENLELAYGSLPAAAGTPSFEARREYVFGLFSQLSERRALVAGSMSGGEQRMLAISMGLMHAPRILLLDEPTTGLAPIVVHLLMDAIQRLNRDDGVATLIVEQNILSMLRIVDDLYLLKDGACRRYDGDPRTITDQRIWEFL